MHTGRAASSLDGVKVELEELDKVRRKQHSVVSYLQSPTSGICETYLVIREWFSEMKSTALIAGVWKRP